MERLADVGAMDDKTDNYRISLEQSSVPAYFQVTVAFKVTVTYNQGI